MANQKPDEDAKVRLVNAAGPIFAALGFERATVRDICGNAGVNIASVGYYFGDKMGLYREVVRQIREDKSRRFPIPDVSSFADPEERLLAFVHTLLQRMLNDGEEGWQVQLLMREMQQPTDALQDIVQDHFGPVFAQLVETLAQIMPEATPVEATEHLALSVIGQCFHYRVGENTIPTLISSKSRELLGNIDALAIHITSVTLSASKGGAFLQDTERLDAILNSRKERTA